MENLSIPFINKTDKFEVDPEAIEYLSNFKEKIGLIAVCGKYRTGKSYLLNRLMQHPSVKCPPGFEDIANNSTSLGFKVGSTINACTKGLWLLKKPIFVKDPEDESKTMPVLIIDTEGLGSTNEDENHDTQVFLLAVLLCSLLVFNSVGNIDEKTIGSLSLMINLSQTLKLRHGSSTDESIEELAKYFPSFFWVIRDFTLQMKDKSGQNITEKEYLEDALKEDLKAVSDQANQKNKLRKMIKHFFQSRDWFTLVRPAEEEKQLQDLNNLDDSHIRPEFLSRLKVLRKRIFKAVKPKKFDGNYLNGSMIAELAVAYTNALNSGVCPTIESAWNYMCTEENEKALKMSLDFWKQEIGKLQKSLPINEEDLLEFFASTRQTAEEIYTSHIITGTPKETSQEYLSKLQKYLSNSQSELKSK